MPSGNAGANDFAVTWSSVANAEGYSVKLLDANDGVVSSNDVAIATTSASFTGLVSSSEYMVVVVALGNHTTTDNSAPATLEVTTAASAAAAPTNRATPPSRVRRVEAANRSKYGRAAASVRTNLSYSSTGSGAVCAYQ